MQYMELQSNEIVLAREAIIITSSSSSGSGMHR